MSIAKAIVRRPRLDEMAFLTKESFRSKASWGYPDSWMELWRDELTFTEEKLTQWMTFVVEYEGVIVACWARSAIQSEACSPGLLFVVPEHHKKGYGRLVAEAIKQEAKRRGLTFFTIEADPNAAPFYKKIGGKQMGEQESLLIPGRILPIIRFEI